MESRMRKILMILTMIVTILNIWLRNVGFSADSGNLEELRAVAQ